MDPANGNSSWRSLEAELRAANTRSGRAQRGVHSIEGLRLFERALRAGRKVERALLAQGLAGSADERIVAVLEALEQAGTQVVFAPDELLETLCEGRDLGRMLGLVALPQAPSLNELLAGAGGRELRLLVLVDIAEPGNVGALVRTALASGAAACVCVGHSDPMHPKAVRTSMGSIFRLPTLQVEGIDSLLAELARLGITSVGAVSAGGSPPWDLNHPGPVALFMGSEAFGLEPRLAARLDARVTIPMPAGVDSYSVNAAAAVLLYETGRPR